MSIKNIVNAKPLHGEIEVPGDKSISHRAVMFGALAEGTTEITNFLHGEDCLSTIHCFEQMGIDITTDKECIHVHGKGLDGLTEPSSVLDTGNSGTTTRILAGILAGQSFSSTINGDKSIQKRPMDRIILPLSQMNADITSLSGNNCTPLRINGRKLSSIDYISPVASAQVKSSILMAGLYADGKTSVTEPYLSRNHTELMLREFGGTIETNNTISIVTPHPHLTAQHVHVPGDISSAAFFIAAALLVPNSEIVIKNIGLNPTRYGIIRVILEMGGILSVENINRNHAEETADLVVRSSSLKGVTIGGSLIPALIDEIPIIAVLACFASGTTVIKDAAELKIKESNRIDTIVKNLSAMNADITATKDGMIIHGGRQLYGAIINPQNDHRIAMALSIASLVSEGFSSISDIECINISFPDFFELLEKLQK